MTKVNNPEKDEKEIEEDADLEDDKKGKDGNGEGEDNNDDEGDGADGRYDNKPKDTVSLKKYMKAKDRIKELQDDLAAAKSPMSASVREIAAELGVEESAATKLIQFAKDSSLKEFEHKFGPILKKDELAKADQAFDTEFDKVVKIYPALASKKKQLKSLAFSKEYLKTPLDKIAEESYGDLIGKPTTEDAAGGSDKGESEKIDFANMTSDQRAKVMKDPELRKKYYAYKDSKEF